MQIYRGHSVLGVHVYEEVCIHGKESHLALCVASIGAMGVSLNELPDCETICSFFWENAYVITHVTTLIGLDSARVDCRFLILATHQRLISEAERHPAIKQVGSRSLQLRIVRIWSHVDFDLVIKQPSRGNRRQIVEIAVPIESDCELLVSDYEQDDFVLIDVYVLCAVFDYDGLIRRFRRCDCWSKARLPDARCCIGASHAEAKQKCR